MNIIEISNLTHRIIGGKPILNNINLTVKEGEFIVVAGANGSGKSTLFKQLNGLLVAGQGQVKVDGVFVAENLKRARQKVGMIFQEADSQIVGETVFDDVAFGPENLGLPGDDVERVVNRTLDLVGLRDLKESPPHILSGGEKRRLAIAGVLAMTPKVIVFDEPFSNLDYPGIQQVQTQMAALHLERHTILVATHNLETVADMADRLILMEEGEIVKDGPFYEVVHSAEAFGVRLPQSVRRREEFQAWLKR